MGTKVMVRASRSFNGYVEGDWYMVDPSDPQQAALISGGYLEHQEELFEGLDLETLAAVEYPLPTPHTDEAERRFMEKAAQRRGGSDGEVEAEPGEHPVDGAGEGDRTGDPHGRANPRRRKKAGPA